MFFRDLVLLYLRGISLKIKNGWIYTNIANNIYRK